MRTRRIGPFEVAPVGLGCMSLDHAYGTPVDAAAGRAVVEAALDLGVTLFDTAALYGFGANETRLGPLLRRHRDRIVLASKGGMFGVDGRRVIDGRPETLFRNCEDSLARLGTDVIDLYYLHRRDPQVPVEDSVGALSRLVEQGKIRAIGLSEVSAATLRRAHAVHPVAAVQTEYSLWSRNPEIGVLAACRELGAGFVAFSPIARGYLGDRLGQAGIDALPDGDIRRGMPRFQAAHWPANRALLAPLRAVAAEAGCTPAQAALAWLLAQDGDIVPIPGTTSVAHLRENVAAAAVVLTPAQLGRLDAAINPRTVSGPRYPAGTQAEIDTEEY
ncbi:aldo/keto reductase [Luteimonas sp. BDR2-5]|uniref:aldo/keto reductase n=1 Tax=Proluteimonas luteida TaxID=2878685 RepID=UPI0031BABAD4